jgi:hypothetical protein
LQGNSAVQLVPWQRDSQAGGSDVSSESEWSVLSG